MSYVYDDVIRLKLPDDKLKDFYSELCRLMKVDTWGELSEPIHNDLIKLLSMNRPIEAYRESLEYLLASSMRDKAIAAYNAVPRLGDERDNVVLTIWLKYADQLTSFEKAMMGWDKI